MRFVFVSIVITISEDLRPSFECWEKVRDWYTFLAATEGIKFIIFCAQWHHLCDGLSQGLRSTVTKTIIMVGNEKDKKSMETFLPLFERLEGCTAKSWISDAHNNFHSTRTFIIFTSNFAKWISRHSGQMYHKNVFLDGIRINISENL